MCLCLIESDCWLKPGHYSQFCGNVSLWDLATVFVFLCRCRCLSLSNCYVFCICTGRCFGTDCCLYLIIRGCWWRSGRFFWFQYGATIVEPVASYVFFLYAIYIWTDYFYNFWASVPVQFTICKLVTGYCIHFLMFPVVIYRSRASTWKNMYNFWANN
jgi:hypothetical protein